MDEVEMMCDRVIFIARGRMIMEGPPREIIKKTNQASLEDLFISIARNGGLYEASGPGEEVECGSG